MFQHAAHSPPVLIRDVEVGRGMSSLDWFASCAACFLGVFLTTISHPGMGPLILAIGYFLLGGFLLTLVRLNHAHERRAFCLTFALCLAATGLARVYAEFLGDLGQNYSDAAHFFQLAANSGSDLALADLQRYSAGGGAIAVWQFFYWGSDSVGIKVEPYIGIYWNTLLVSISAALSVHIGRLVYGEDARRLRIVGNLVASCGLCWLFAAIHLRDCFALLLNTLLIVFWVRLHVKPSVIRFLAAAAGSAALAPAMWTIREESVWLAVFFPAAAFFAWSLTWFKHPFTRLCFAAAAFATAVLISSQIHIVSEDLRPQFDRARFGYMNLTQVTHDYSLGVSHVSHAPLPIRAVAGAAYLYVFPIPFWNGFQLGSAYHLFKSCNAVYLYALGPLFLLGLMRAFSSTSKQSAAALSFLALVILMGFVGVAVTSLETRHVGQFLPALFVIAAAPNLLQERDRVPYRMIGALWSVGLLSIYLAWALLKFVF